jgi:filamentous hemagglutinin family protein
MEPCLAFVGEFIVLKNGVFVKELEMKANQCRRRRLFLIANKLVSVITLIFFSAGNVFALPAGQQVVNGQASFATQGNNLTITNTPNSIIHWQGFSINNNEAVRFIQQYGSSAVLNRVIGQDPSRILGLLQSNGRVFLINPNGILFGQGARIDVNGLFASTLNIGNQDFLAGKYNFTAGTVAGSIQNQGTITTPEGGKVYLIAPDIENSGIINSPKGDVLLAAGHSVHLVDSLDPDISVVVSAPESKAVNLGQIVARSGKVGIYGGLIAQRGIVNADSAVSEGGRIFLKATKSIELADTSVISADGAKGGQIIAMTAEGGQISGTLTGRGLLSAQGDGTSGSGGFIETSAAKVDLNDIRVRTKGGNWLIDPMVYDFTIAAGKTGTVTPGTPGTPSGDISGATLTDALGSGSVTILSSQGSASGNGDIFVNDTVNWSANELTLNAFRNISINSPLNGSGTAKLALYYGQGSETGYINDVVSTYSVNAPVNLPAGNNFSTNLGSLGTPVVYTVITSLGAAADATTAPGTATLQGMAATANLTGNYALGSNIDATATSGWNSNAGFAPIGNSSSIFAGKFDGLGHTISGLKIDRPTTDYVGLFGYTGSSAIIQNVALVDGTITGQSYLGGLVGYNSGTISNSYSTGAVNGGAVGGNGTVIGHNVGGLVGYNDGTISNSYSTGAITGIADVGGLVGDNESSRTISNSYSTGAVTGVTGTGDVGDVGGLVGENRGTISNSYSTGAVTGTNYVGGLVGYGYGGSISKTYSTGAVNGTASIGGLLGGYGGGSITNSYWDKETSGWDTSAGGTGKTTAGMTQYEFGEIGGWNFADTWWMSDTNTRPFLRSEYRTTIANAHQLQLMAMYPGASYNLANHIDLGPELAAVSGKYPGMWGAAGFVPVGNNTTSFTGVFDGLGHTISGLKIDRPTTDYVGLFGSASSAIIKSVGLVSGNITGQSYVGGLVGYNSGTISSSYSKGDVTGSGDYVGGLVGRTYSGSTITANSYSTGAVTGRDYVGGLVGGNYKGTISDSYSTGTVTGTGDNYVGGLVGHNYGYGGSADISNSYHSTGTVSGNSYVGGLVGHNYGYGGSADISNSYSTGTVTGTGYYIGGLVGYNYGYNGSADISSSYHSTGTVTGTGDYVGGLVGKNYGYGNWGHGSADISDSHSTGTVTGGTGAETGNYVGGLVGYNGGYLNYSGSGYGGHADISNSYSTGATVEGTGSYVGGLVGRNYHSPSGFANISDSYSTGNVTGGSAGGYGVGGLVGYNEGSASGTMGTISNSYSTGAVNGPSQVGGLVGKNYYGAISNSYSTGEVGVSGTPESGFGGLVGYNEGGAISNSYSTGAVSGDNYVGGLVGTNEGSISNSYSTGALEVTVTGAGSYVGGLVGVRYSGSITSSNWDKDTSGRTIGIGGAGASQTGVTGLTTADMMTQTKFTDWSFVDPVEGVAIWRIYEGKAYPLLKNFLTAATVTAKDDSKTYSGLAYSGGNGVTCSTGKSGICDAKYLLGGDGGTSPGAINAGTYTITPSGYYSSQQGYDISFTNGALTVNPYAVSMTGSRTYDGTKDVAAGIFTLGTLVGSETLTLAGAGTVADRNVGTAKAVTLGTLALGDGSNGGLAGNYTFSGGTQTADITARDLTVTATGVNKVYDGLTGATVILADNRVAGDTLTTAYASAAYLDKNAAVGKTVNVSGITLTSTDAGNYTFNTTAATKADITARGLTVTAATNTKPYDRNTSAAALPTITSGSLVDGDTAALTEVYDSKIAGTGKTLIPNAAVISDGNGGNNYLVTYVNNTTGVIEPGQIVSGRLDVATGGKTIDFAVNGALLPDQAATDESGNYSLMFPLNAIPDNSALLAYVANDGSVKSASIYLSTGGDIADLLLSSNTVTGSGGGTMSNTIFGDAKGALSSGDIPYTVSGNILTLSSGFNLAMNAGGDITLNGLINAGTGIVTLNSGGAIINDMGSSLSISAGSLFAEAVNGIGSGDPLMTGVNRITALNTTANHIEIDNTGVLTLSGLRNLGTGNVILQNSGAITTDTSPVASSGGAVSITARSPLTIGSGGVSASGHILLEAAPSGDSDNLTINGNIASSNGNIILKAGSSIVFGPGSGLSAPNGTIMLTDDGNNAGSSGTEATGNTAAANNTVVALKTTEGTTIATAETTSDSEDKEDEEDKKKKKEGGEQTTDDNKKDDDTKKYCN